MLLIFIAVIIDLFDVIQNLKKAVLVSPWKHEYQTIQVIETRLKKKMKFKPNIKLFADSKKYLPVQYSHIWLVTAYQHPTWPDWTSRSCHSWIFSQANTNELYKCLIRTIRFNCFQIYHLVIQRIITWSFAVSFIVVSSRWWFVGFFAAYGFNKRRFAAKWFS